VKAYKGTDKDLKCRDYQYEVGKDYETTEPVKLCEHGFHACENPLDVFGYYDPAGSRFLEVEQSGDIKIGEDKTVSSQIHIKTELTLTDIIKAGVDIILEKAKKIKSNTGYASASTNTGDASASTNTGDRSASTNTGDASASTNTGYASASRVTGKNSIALAFGINSRASASQGGWIVIADWRNNGQWYIKDVYKAKVFEKIKNTKIKPDVYYWFENGKLKSSEAQNG